MEKEIWKDIQGYEGLYQVSNCGRVKSVKRTAWSGLNGGCYVAVHGRILKPSHNGQGYLFVNLSQDGKEKQYLIHRLVGQAFIPNPNNLPIINHKDENPKNNNVDNLEWCTQKYNINYGTRNEKASEKMRGRKHSEEHNKKVAEKLTNHPKKSKPVFSVDKVTGEIKEYPSAHEAERQTGIAQSDICRCLKGKRKSCGGFYWHYVDDKEVANE